MKVYPLRDIPDDLWKAVKILAIKRGTTVRELILFLLIREVEADSL